MSYNEKEPVKIDGWIIALLQIVVVLIVCMFFAARAEAYVDDNDPLVALYADTIARQEAQELVDVLNNNPRMYLYWYGSKVGLSKWEIMKMDSIIDCESEWAPSATNGQYKGLFQIGTWEYATYGEGNPLNAIDNIRSGIAYYRVTGFHVWSCA